MWTDEQTATAVKMWDEGHSAATIAVEIGGGLSRNAVIGKVHRMGLPRRQTVSFRKSDGALARKNAPKPKLIRPPAFRVEPIPEPVSPSIEHRVSFFSLANQHCRYPLWCTGTPFAEQFYCGSPQADVAEGRSFCPFHQARTRQKGSMAA